VPNPNTVGAEVRGVDLAADLGDADFNEIRAALNTHSVLYFRNQTISHVRHIELTEKFGPIRMPRTMTPYLVPEYPAITVLSNIVKDGKPIGVVDAGRCWHSDNSYTQRPNAAALLYAVKIPFDDSGNPLGTTLFVS